MRSHKTGKCVQATDNGADRREAGRQGVERNDDDGEGS